MRAAWRELVTGFWFVPGAVALLGALLAAGTLALDHAASGGEGVTLAFGGDAEAARQILATIAGSLITVAGLAFSITIVVLTLVSNQFTPRAIRGFLADRVNQVVAGAFVGIFIYSLLVLRAVRGNTIGDRFVPGISVSVAIVLALVALALLLVFIHHVGKSIQASSIAARISRETLRAIDHLYPAAVGERSGAPAEVTRPAGEPTAAIRPDRHGFVQTIKLEALARKLGDALAEVPVRPGDFVNERDVLALVWLRDMSDADLESAVRGAVVIADERDVAEDAAFGIWQLADIAARALSPGVNDPTTAVTALAHLEAVLVRLAGRSIPSGTRRVGDADVVAATVSFTEFVEGPFGEIARSLGGNARVAAAALGSLRSISEAALEAGMTVRLDPLRTSAQAVLEAVRGETADAFDRRLLDRAAADAASVLGPLG